MVSPTAANHRRTPIQQLPSILFQIPLTTSTPSIHSLHNSRTPTLSMNMILGRTRHPRMAVEDRSHEDHSEDISKYAAKVSSYDALSTYQMSHFFNRHGYITKTDCSRIATTILKNPVSPAQVQGRTKLYHGSWLRPGVHRNPISILGVGCQTC